MQCHHCSTIGMDTDPCCLRCGKPFKRGISQGTLAHTMGWIFAGFMGVAVSFVNGVSRLDELLVNAVATGLLMMAAGLVGAVFGWVIGAFACES
jgi:hypothetical protein